MQVAVDSVVVKDRIRKEPGNIDSLKKSMHEIGQLSPLVLTRQNQLISGYRRLTAAKELGWHSIEAEYVDRDSEVDRLQMELEENVHRKDFTPEEVLAGYHRLEKLKSPGLKKKMGKFFKRVGGFFAGLFKRKDRKADSESGEEADEYSSF
ncbi:MAG: ParB N-terminal domain-containing protein [Verrucomicrobiota bacterium]